jgi:hypothetical protein
MGKLRGALLMQPVWALYDYVQPSKAAVEELYARGYPRPC